MCQDEKAQDQMLKELNDIGKKNGFKGLELLQCVMCVRRAICRADLAASVTKSGRRRTASSVRRLGGVLALTPASPSPEASAQGDPVQIRGRDQEGIPVRALVGEQLCYQADGRAAVTTLLLPSPSSHRSSRLPPVDAMLEPAVQFNQIAPQLCPCFGRAVAQSGAGDVGRARIVRRPRYAVATVQYGGSLGADAGGGLEC